MKESDARAVYIYDLTSEIMGVFEHDLNVENSRYEKLQREVALIVAREYVPIKKQGV